MRAQGAEAAVSERNGMDHLDERESEYVEKKAQLEAMYRSPQQAQGQILGGGGIYNNARPPFMGVARESADAFARTMAAGRAAADVPPLLVELKALEEAISMQAQLLAELEQRLAAISRPQGQGKSVDGQAAPQRSTITETIHTARERVMGHNTEIRNMLSALEI